MLAACCAAVIRIAEESEGTMRTDHLQEMLFRHRSDRGREALIAAAIPILALAFTIVYFIGGAR